jgi:hypothetical protein
VNNNRYLRVPQENFLSVCMSSMKNFSHFFKEWVSFSVKYFYSRIGLGRPLQMHCLMC